MILYKCTEKGCPNFGQLAPYTLDAKWVRLLGGRYCACCGGHVETIKVADPSTVTIAEFGGFYPPMMKRRSR